MTTISPNAPCNEVMLAESHCSCEDVDESLIYSRFERLVKDQEQLGKAALPVLLLLTAVAVAAAHAKAHGNSICYSLDARILNDLEISLDELIPAFIAMDAAGCISMKSTGDGLWAFRFVPTAMPTAHTSDATIEQENIMKTPSANLPISHGKKRRPTFINIGPGGFCDCDDSRRALNYPEGKKIFALAMLAYPHISNSIPLDGDAIYTKGDGKLYVTYTYEFYGDNFDEKALDKEYCLGIIDDWPVLGSRARELAQMMNSAANVFPWDKTMGADVERTKREHIAIEGMLLINQDAVVIELGVTSDGSGRNFIKRVLEPGDSDYLRVRLLNEGVGEGTGLIGKHIPPNLPLRTNPQGISP